MSAPIPATVFAEIEKQLAHLLLDLPGYLPADDERIIAWNDELHKLMSVGGRVEAFIGIALISHLLGDIDAVERFLTRAETAGGTELQIAAPRSAIYLNLGFFSKALPICTVLYSAPALNLGYGLPRVISCGGFAHARKLLNEARLAKIDLSHVSQIRQIEQIAEGAAQNEYSDEQYAQVLDVAGEVMRKHRVFWLERSPRMSFDSELRCAGIRYRVDMTPRDAGKLTDEFIDGLLNKNLAHIPLSIRFIGTKTEPANSMDLVEAVAV